MDNTTLTSLAAATRTPNAAEMRKLSGRATTIFMALIHDLRGGDAKKLDNAPGAFMAVSIDCLLGDEPRGGDIGWALYAIAHRYEVNGDLVSDPDVEFYVANDPARPEAVAVYPIAIDQGVLGYRRYVQIDGAGQPIRLLVRGQANLARFCEIWMRNIASQQLIAVR